MDTVHSLRKNVGRTLSDFRKIAGKELFAYCVVAAIQVAASLLQIWFGGRIINDLVGIVGQKETASDGLIFDLAMLITFSIIEQISWALLTYFERKAYQKWSGHNYFTFLSKTSRLTLGQFEDKELKQKMHMLWQEGYAWKPANFALSILYIFHAGLRMISTFVILASLLPILIPVLLLASVPTLLVEKRAAAMKWAIWGSKGDDAQRFWTIANLLYSRDTVLEITPQGSRDLLLGRATNAINRFIQAQIKVMRRFLWMVLSTRLLEGLVMGAVNIWLIWKVVSTQGKFTIGEYSIYAGVVQQFQSSTGQVYKHIVDLLDNNHFMTIYNDFLGSQSPLVMPANPVKLSRTEPITIEYKHVSFTYPHAKQPIFTDLNLVIKPGDHLAIVGQNGAGKSTLIKLLLRFYDVDEGQILVNGVDLRELDLDSWYYHVGALFQTFNHYPFTLDENVSIGRPQRPPQAKLVAKALGWAGIARLTDSFEHGAKTILDPSFEKGTELSGGQWQKVALARAFYRDASVLILDEPTSAVDAKAEYEIFEQIRKTQADKTTLIVSHRFSTVRQAARILVIDDGKIVEDGSHETLVKQEGLYKDMFDKQAEGYR